MLNSAAYRRRDVALPGYRGDIVWAADASLLQFYNKTCRAISLFRTLTTIFVGFWNSASNIFTLTINHAPGFQHKMTRCSTIDNTKLLHVFLVGVKCVRSYDVFVAVINCFISLCLNNHCFLFLSLFLWYFKSFVFISRYRCLYVLKNHRKC